MAVCKALLPLSASSEDWLVSCLLGLAAWLTARAFAVKFFARRHRVVDEAWQDSIIHFVISGLMFIDCSSAVARLLNGLGHTATRHYKLSQTYASDKRFVHEL